MGIHRQPKLPALFDNQVLMLNGYGITRYVCQKRGYFRDIHLNESQKYFSKHEKHLNGIYFVGDGIGFVEEWRLYFRKYKLFG